MSKLSIRGENPVGTWTIIVKDQVNPDKTGRFIAWGLQLWGESVDPSLAKLWAPAEEGQPDEEEIGSDPTATKVQQKPKPTDHLPDDHGEADGEAHQPGLGGGQASPTEGEDIEEPSQTGEIDEGFFDGIEDLASNSTWIAGAGGIVILSGAVTSAFFYLRARRRKRNLFGFANNGEGARGAYQPVGEDDVPMGLLGRRGKNADGSKELYDAFGDGPSDESDLDTPGERTALRYHDDFLGDDEDHPPGYRDEPEGARDGSAQGRAEGSGTREGTPRREGDSHSGSTGSWQDAAEEVPKS